MQRTTIRDRIIYGYTCVLGVALVGMTAGITLGNHYQRQAQAYREATTAERRLLNQLQIGILQYRPAKQLAPSLEDADHFRQEGQRLLGRITEVQEKLGQYHQAHGVVSSYHLRFAEGRSPWGASARTRATSAVPPDDLELSPLMAAYEVTLAQFYARAQGFVQVTAALSGSPADLEAAQQNLLDLVQSPEFIAFIELPAQLAAFDRLLEGREQSAEQALAQAERLRIWITASSLLMSALAAFAIAKVTSRAIAQPVQTVTAVARRVTEENNFDLQVPITRQDEVGVLATSLNQLIHRVKVLLTQLNQKNSDLETALDQLNQQHGQLMQQEKMSALGRLVAGVAHEINNPINFIYGNLTHARTYTDDLLTLIALYRQHYPQPYPAIQHQIEATDLDFTLQDLPQLLNSMKVGAERINSIVSSLRVFSRMDESEFAAADLHASLESTLSILQHRLKAKFNRPEIQVVRSYAQLPSVECCIGQINQVFMNLIANAIDAVEESSARRSYEEIAANPNRITIRTAVVDGEWVEVAIADNGCGIPEHLQGKIFEPFFTTKPVGQGTGIGMSISYEIIVKKHQGRLRCASVSGQGTEMSVHIPIHRSLSPEQPEPGPALSARALYCAKGE